MSGPGSIDGLFVARPGWRAVPGGFGILVGRSSADIVLQAAVALAP
jgi:hypothetical protein